MFNKLKKSGKPLRIAKRPLTRENLAEAITTLYPQILVINCHGSMTNNKNYYLCFEQVEKPLLLDKFTEKDMSDLWEGIADHHKIKLVVFACCHSEPFGKIIKNVGKVPHVLCIKDNC